MPCLTPYELNNDRFGLAVGVYGRFAEPPHLQ
jgi:hypothetical protein